MNGVRISFSQEAEHVGILRTNLLGNKANLLARKSAQIRAVHAALPAGLTRDHLGNQAAALRVEKVYGLTVLLSGLCALVLWKSELETLDHH